MPRPRKWRRVCRLPQNTLFGPLAGIGDGTIVMTVEEYETIRLIDLEGLNQEACAERMHVARTTAQAMYRNARHKIADCLVNSRRLIIEGGDYLVCNAREMTCGCPHCRRLIQPADGETPDNNTMNEIICSITSAIEEGRSWGHTDKEIANYIYAKHIRPLETKLAEAPEPRAAFLEGFMLTTKSRNGENPFAGDYAEAWKAIASHAGVSQRAFEAIEGGPDESKA